MKIAANVAKIIVILFFGLILWAVFNKDLTPATTSTFTSINGEKLALTDLRGKPVLVTFWATTCGSCRKEIPHLIELYNRFHPRGFELIAVAMVYDPPNQVVQMAKDLNLPYKIALDFNSEHADAFGGIWATPTTYLINADGTVDWHTVGMFEPNDLAQRIERQLGE